MKKNIIVLLIAMALLVGALSGCTETTEEETEEEETEEEETEEEETEEEEEEETPTMPIAGFTYDPMVNITNTTLVTFTAVVTLGDAVNITYFWDFGDGTNATTEVANHHIT